ncbi:hypothetical protein JANAI62_04080 [Jannaschia pagri]|uniref:Uncharacterized protein n=1 Tax=Jannaschia pagri TaxID=2829797 RepID=A0ABQ4NH97_9RHOB|nr:MULTISPECIES: hypothetical protein [unclassified Jannaschia]GIT90109.1 hypothetical protein JANAI61_05670 [Jannaschia sp. AI_61]GIT93785.1 hypothetical protein JANAI62_04080 [Jannaschia sp. AI_62]
MNALQERDFDQSDRVVAPAPADTRFAAVYETSFHRNRLAETMAHARAQVQAHTQHANESTKSMPAGDPEAPGMALYLKSGRASMFFLIWASFIAPILLVLSLWD